MSWCTIESDPGVFTELIEELGVKDVAVSEVYSFDFVEEWQRESCHGFIYLFNDFKGFASVLDSESMGITIGNHDGIRKVHNSFARPEPFVMDEEDKLKRKGKEQDLFHFVAYIPFQGVLYELDGLKPGPVRLAEVSSGNWFDVARPVIEQRMRNTQDIKSVLLAVGRSRIASLTEQLATTSSEEERASLQAQLLEEQALRDKQKIENTRRRHNFFPFILQLTTALGREGKLAPMVEAAKEKKAEAHRIRVAATKGSV
eukprot:GSChrysophyteH1.ASY1.ANO1.1586.1 assembled CDS